MTPLPLFPRRMFGRVRTRRRRLVGRTLVPDQGGDGRWGPNQGRRWQVGRQIEVPTASSSRLSCLVGSTQTTPAVMWFSYEPW